GRNLTFREDPRRDLIQERLKQVIVVPVDESDVDRAHGERLGGEETPEPAADDDDLVARLGGPGGRAVVESAALIQHEEQHQRRDHERREQNGRDEEPGERRPGRRSLIDGQRRREHVWVLGDSPADEHRDHGGDGQKGHLPTGEQSPQPSQGGESEDRRRDHERERYVQEPVVDVRSVVTEHEQADERSDAGQKAHDERADAEVRHHHVVVVALGVGHEERRGDEGRDQHAEDPDGDRRRVQPARPETSGLVARRYTPRGDPAERGAEHEGGDDRRDSEGDRERTSASRSLGDLAKGEAGPPNDDADPRQDDRDEQRPHNRAPRGRERGPAHDGGDDDPNVVGLPYGGQRVVDEATRPLPASRSSG